VHGRFGVPIRLSQAVAANGPRPKRLAGGAIAPGVRALHETGHRMTSRTLAEPVFDHLSIGVASLERAIDFYDAALAPLGLRRLWRRGRAAGYEPEGFGGEAPFAALITVKPSRERRYDVQSFPGTQVSIGPLAAWPRVSDGVQTILDVHETGFGRDFSQHDAAEMLTRLEVHAVLLGHGTQLELLHVGCHSHMDRFHA
jgi:catechol 2,3-dioxygenase-like lactoylglutathione lyase family enzyme